jgi:hypothetical protein
VKRSILRAAAEGLVTGLRSDSGPLPIHINGERVVIETPTLRIIGMAETVDIPEGKISVVIDKEFHRRE